ncbi:glutathione S-transferase, partial [Pavlovales sp. CCMP2436]
ALQILRYAGRLGGTYPTDPVRALAVDEVLGMNAEVIDLANLPGHASIFLPGDPAKYTATAGKMISEKKLPALLQTWEHMLAKNGSGYFVGREPTIADFAVASTIDMLRTGFYESCHSISPKVVDGFPRLNALVDLIKDIPGVHRYREEKQ